jgi:hypothetical protein
VKFLGKAEASMAEFCSRCGKTLSIIDPLLELHGLRFCEDCYPEVKREHAATSMNERTDRKSRTVFAMDEESEESLRGAIMKGKEALANRDNEFKWDNPSLSLIASALRILNEQNKVIIKQNDLLIKELDNARMAPVKTK